MNRKSCRAQHNIR